MNAPLPRPTRTVVTPVHGHKVVLKEWITGAEREYIEAPMFQAVQVKPQVAGRDARMDIASINVQQLVEQSGNREIETFVVSVDDSAENVLDAVKGMHEDDTAFVREAIKEIASKKKESSTTAESA
jgi:hypothetical protein